MKDLVNVMNSISEATNSNFKMIVWIAERTLSVKDFREFIKEFTKESDRKHYDALADLLKEDGEAE